MDRWACLRAAGHPALLCPVLAGFRAYKRHRGHAINWHIPWGHNYRQESTSSSEYPPMDFNRIGIYGGGGILPAPPRIITLR